MTIRYVIPKIYEKEKIHEEFKNVLDSGRFVFGEYTERLKEEIRKIHNVEYVTTTNSGTSATAILLKSVQKFKKQNKIYMPAFTWDSTKTLCKWLKYKIQYIDIYRDSWIMEFSDFVENYKTDDGILFPTSTFGNFCDYDGDNLIIDSAHCLGLKNTGNRGLGEIFSLAPAKTITGGEGGIITTTNKSIYETAEQYSKSMGRLSEFNSIIAYYNLKNKDKTLERKKQLYNYYKKELKDFEFQNILFDSTYNEIACLIPNKKRDLLIRYLEVLKYKRKPQ